jgi:hypothetical protein
LREETLAGRRRVLPADHPDTLWSMNRLAYSYMALNRHAEALPHINEVLAKADGPGVDPRVILTTFEARIQCCQKLDDVAGCRVLQTPGV